MHIYNLIYCCQLSRSFLSVLSNPKITMSLDKISFQLYQLLTEMIIFMNKLNTILILLLLLFHIHAIEPRHQQRGGGSRGGGFRGGSSFGSRSYGRYGYGYSTVGNIISGSLVGAFCCCGIWMVVCKKYCKKNKLKQLQKKYNTIDTSSISEQQFNRDCYNIIDMIKKSESNQNFAYEQNLQKKYIKASVEIIKQEPFNTQIKIKGNDEQGPWIGSGNIICRNGTIFMWFYKQYQNRENAGQTGQWEHLIYESNRYDDNVGVDGVWFFDGFQGNSQYSGKWQLHYPSNPYFSNNNVTEDQYNANPYGNY